MSTVLYGIPNCDTVKKARAWLKAREVEVVFHDFKKSGVPEAQLQRWLDALGWQPLTNRQGTTWRKLDAAERDAVHNDATAAALLKAHPSVIKRPVVEWPDGSVTVGFSEEEWGKRLGA